jgi:hypothetical protein
MLTLGILNEFVSQLFRSWKNTKGANLPLLGEVKAKNRIMMASAQVDYNKLHKANIYMKIDLTLKSACPIIEMKLLPA